jgi:hypothetical protein
MQKDRGDLTSLLYSTTTQQDAYRPLEALRVFPLHGHFAPMLAGTVPLDMVCSVARGPHGRTR